MVFELDHICEVENSNSAQGGMVASCGVNMVRQLRSNTHCCFWSRHIKTTHNSLALPSISKKVGTRCRSPSYERFGRMQFTLHTTRRTPHGASRLVQAMPAWLVKTRRAPSRHSGDARVYGHTTTAMHKRSTWCTPIYLGGFTKTK